MSEQWKPITGYEGLYEVSDHGRVRSVARTVKDKNRRQMRLREKILRPGRNPKGYLIVTLSKEGKTKTFLLSRFVCAAFNGPPEDGQFCLHGDGDPDNNRPSNLRWGDHAANMKDMIKHGNNGFVLDADKARKIYAMIGKVSRKEIAERFGISKTNVCQIARGQIWAEATGAKRASAGKLSGNKMDAETARRIFNLKGHIKPKSLAEFFGVSKATISHIFSGKTWAHVTGAGGES